MTVETVLYWIPEDGETENDSCKVELPKWYDWQSVAACVAEHYHAFHDGWDHNWPITFAVRRGLRTSTFSVNREVSLAFLAMEVDTPL